MFDHRSDSGSGQQPEYLPANLQQSGHERRLLELQLIQIRSEASAAKLEARAAEIEIMLRRMVMAESGVATALDAPLLDLQTIARRQAAGTAPPPVAMPSEDLSAGSVKERPSPAATASEPPASGMEMSIQPKSRKTGSLKSPSRHRVSSQESERCAKTGQANRTASSRSKPRAETFVEIAESKADRTKAPLRDPKPLGTVAPANGPTPEPRRRSRPTAVLFSAAIHSGLLFLLAAISLRVPRLKDQVSLTAVSADAAPEPITTVTVESSEPQVEPTQPTEAQADVSLDQLAEVVKVNVDSGDTEFAPMDSLVGSGMQSTSSNALSLSSNSPGEKITFCGVEGGGNHFVYLVDCSKSMGAAFESARAELLHSIETLKPHQRFYVIFFDASPDYMRLTQPGVDDPHSVVATAENKQALRRWAASIKMDSGEAPYKPLQFALQLRPDVIFLLSDGEFPAGIERLLQEENHLENLFGDQDVKSIVHTIGYHSLEGESRMRAIAAQNQGQYRHVPKPGPSR